MPVKSDTKPAQDAGESKPASSSFALLFQLEDLSGSLRRAAFDTLKERAGKSSYGVGDFIRSGLAEAPLAGLPGAVDAEAGAVRERILARLRAAPAELPQALRKLFKAARERLVTAQALTLLPEAEAESLAGKLGLAELGVSWAGIKDGEGDVLKTEAWIKAARGVGRSVRKCGALVASLGASRGALAAGLRCVALPDEYTAFRDFGGAVMVFEDLEEFRPAEVLDTLFPPRRLGA